MVVSPGVEIHSFSFHVSGSSFMGFMGWSLVVFVEGFYLTRSSG